MCFQVQISRIISESTIDYPGKFGPVFFSTGCNFACDYCYNYDLVEDARVMEKEEVDNFLRGISRKIKRGFYNGATISGGEPTLQLGIGDFSRRLKDMGLAVKLDTNGSNPDVLKYLKEQRLADYVAMDIKTCREKYFQFVGAEYLDFRELEKSIALVSQFPDYEFRTTCIESEHDEDKIRKMGEWICGVLGEKPKRFCLQAFVNTGKLRGRFKNEKDADKNYVERLARVMGDYAKEVVVR